jgi:hypothetical protein
MKHTSEQLILAAHVRTLALDFLRNERNALSDKWHAEHPGESREMNEFVTELTKSKPFNEFIRQAAQELGNIVDVMLQPTKQAEDQG